MVVLTLLQEEDLSKSLISASGANRWNEVEVLLQKPLSPDAGDIQPRMALHLAASNGHGRCLGLLLEAGADKDKLTATGEARLHLALLDYRPENPTWCAKGVCVCVFLFLKES